MNTKINSDAPSVGSSALLEYSVDLEIYDPLQNRRVEKLDVIEAMSEKDAYSRVCWKYGDSTEIKRITLF